MSFIHLNLSRALLALEEPKKALQQAEQGLALEPDMLSLHLARARALVALKREPEAIAQYQEALALQPDSQPTRKALIDLLFDQNQFEPMHAQAQLLVESGTQPGWAEWALGASLQGLGRKAEARLAFNKARSAYLEQGDQENAQFCQSKMEALNKPQGGLFARLFGKR